MSYKSHIHEFTQQLTLINKLLGMDCIVYQDEIIQLLKMFNQARVSLDKALRVIEEYNDEELKECPEDVVSISILVDLLYKSYWNIYGKLHYCTGAYYEQR